MRRGCCRGRGEMLGCALRLPDVSIPSRRHPRVPSRGPSEGARKAARDTVHAFRTCDRSARGGSCLHVTSRSFPYPRAFIARAPSRRDPAKDAREAARDAAHGFRTYDRSVRDGSSAFPFNAACVRRTGSSGRDPRMTVGRSAPPHSGSDPAGRHAPRPPYEGSEPRPPPGPPPEATTIRASPRPRMPARREGNGSVANATATPTASRHAP